MLDRLKFSLVCGLMTAATVGALHAGEIRGEVVDPATGRPVPCRLYVQHAGGEFLFAKSAAPEGQALVYNVFRPPGRVETHVTLSAHGFVVEAPAGRCTLVAERGKEWAPAAATVDVGDGPVNVRLEVRRWIDMPARGWWSGDTHVHRRLDEMPNLQLAEDLHVALPLTNWVRDSLETPSQGTLQPTIPPGLVQIDPTHAFWTMNTEYEIFTVKGQRHTLGAVFVLGHRRPLDLAAPPVQPIAAVAREQGGLLDLDKHSWPWSMMVAPVMNVDLFELSNNHIWRTEFLFANWTIEALPEDWDIETNEFGFTEWGWMDFGFKTYYALLNCGLPMRPTGGTASGVHPVPLGYGRVYVHLDGAFRYEDWIDGLNAGRSFVTTGPLLDLRFNEQHAGARFSAAAPHDVAILGDIASLHPLDRVEVIVNGEVAQTLHPESSALEAAGRTAALRTNVRIEGSSWLCVRCFERLPSGRVQFAHTAPVYVDIPDRPLRPRRREIAYFLKRMDEELTRNAGVLTDDELSEYRAARDWYEGVARAGELRP